jgi:hypothetical protein
MSAKRAAVAAATVVSCLLLAPSVLGFGTINGAGQRAEHERITRAALACSGPASSTCFEPTSITNLAGGSGTAGGVGSPDADEIFNGAAHCDNADFLATPGYPQSRAGATATLLECRAHLRGRFMQAVTAAARLLDDRGRIKAAEVDLSSSCTFVGGVSGRAKCDVLEGLGRTLHGAEDFYSHSNWADEAAPARATGVDNPPGLGNAGVAPVLGLRPAAPPAVPADLSTGCFSLVPFGCRNRITHGVLNKDEGLVDPASGATSDPRTPRGRIGTNFNRAVAGAVAEARRQWADMSAELVSRYGAAKGNLMICAITRDDPLKSCTGRRVVIVIDSSGSNTETDPSNLRIAAGQTLNANLIAADEAADGELPDLSAVVDFDTAAKLVSPLADPSAASFAGIDSAGGTDIGAGVSLAIAELTKDPSAVVKDRSGIVVLTDGLDGGTSLPGALAQAAALGIRVNFGFLSPPAPPRRARARAAQQPPFTPSPALVESIAATGGLYSVIENALAQQAFVDLVQRSGMTNLEDPNGSASGGPLALGASSTGVLSALGTANTHEYRTRPWRPVSFTVRGLAGQKLTVAVRDVRSGAALASAAPDAGGTAVVPAQAVSGQYAVDVTAVEGTGAYEISVTESGVDLIGTPKADTLNCTAGATFVSGGAGNDTVTCGAAADAIAGGRGADRAAAGAGDDVFIVSRADARRGIERLDGGEGSDRALFLFPKPRGTRCRNETTSRIRVGKRGRVRLSGVERVEFNYAPCSARAIRPPRLTSLGSRGGSATQSVQPPKPRLRIVSRRPLRITVRVSRATSVVVVARLTVGNQSVLLPGRVRNAKKRQTLRFTLPQPPSGRGRLAITAVTAGAGGAVTRRDTARLRL